MPRVLRRARRILGLFCARLADAGEVALDVGGEDRHADAAEGFGDDLEGDGLAGAGGAGDQAVAIGERGQQHEVGFGVGLLCDQHRLGHSSISPVGNVSSILKVHRSMCGIASSLPSNYSQACLRLS